MSKKITSLAFISSTALVLVNFRGELLKRLVESDLIVYVLAPDFTEKDKKEVEELGAIPVDYSLKRTGLNPWQDLKSLVELYLILRRLQVDAILCNFIKPVIYGSWAAYLAGIKRKFSLISGLGYVFTEHPDELSYKRRFLRGAVSRMYKLALDVNERVFFQNPDDMDIFIESGLVDKQKTKRVFGSGVDLDRFKFEEPKTNPLRFIFVGRFLKEKGINELFEAVRLVRYDFPDVKLLLLGDIDENQGSITRAEVEELVEEGVVEWPGRVDDIKPWMRDSSVFILPSWREGTPRSALEAMAMGRPIITNDVPGCRETVFFDEVSSDTTIKYGINGILVQARDVLSLKKAMEFFLEKPERVRDMGKKSRDFAEERYDVHKVNEDLINNLYI